MAIKISADLFGLTSKGQEVKRYVLENANGMKVSIIDFGASIQSITLPNTTGDFSVDVTQGYDSVQDYENDDFYMGALCGRVTNRVSNAEVTIDGITSKLSVNDPPNHIHGGFKGFNKMVFTSREVADGVEMSYTSADGEEGYPGQLTVTATYRLTADDRLTIDVRAVTTKPTVANLVQHTYFNLAGHDKASIYDHTLVVNADEYTPKKENGYPTGKIVSASGTVFDFSVARALGESIDVLPDDRTGYDHNFCLKHELRDCSEPAARLEHPGSGRVLEVFTNQPGLQVYTANYLNGSRGKGGAFYHKHSAICLETQNYPDAINQPNFPNAVLRPELPYHHRIAYHFVTAK